MSQPSMSYFSFISTFSVDPKSINLEVVGRSQPPDIGMGVLGSRWVSNSP